MTYIEVEIGDLIKYKEIPVAYKVTKIDILYFHCELLKIKKEDVSWVVKIQPDGSKVLYRVKGMMRAGSNMMLTRNIPPMSLSFESLDLYPVTIVKDRYNGTYSGGKWLAFNHHPEVVPKEIYSNDTICSDFWRENLEVIGRGDSSQEAFQDLISRLLKEKNKYEVITEEKQRTH